MSDSKKIDIAALFIAILSFILSLISLWFSNTQVELTKGQVKAYVQVTEAKLQEPVTDASFVRVQLRLKNFGQTAAVNVHGDMDYNDVIPPAEEGNYATTRDFRSMGPGLERLFTLQSNRRNNRQFHDPSMRGDHQLYFFGTVWYVDDTTREKRHEDWCYQLVIKTEDDLKKTDLEPCEILTYHSKNDPWADHY